MSEFSEFVTRVEASIKSQVKLGKQHVALTLLAMIAFTCLFLSVIDRLGWWGGPSRVDLWTISLMVVGILSFSQIIFNLYRTITIFKGVKSDMKLIEESRA